MNIWIVKKGEDSFTQSYINNSVEVTKDIDQLKNKNIFQKTFDKFHLLSIYTDYEYCQKKYIQVKEKEVFGYSGLIIDNTSELSDLRDVVNVKINNMNSYSGQYAIFEISNNEFKCRVDNLGFHKVFYFSHKKDIYVTNSIELLGATGLLKPNIEQVLLDLMTSRFGIYPGNNTLFEDVYMLPEYGEVLINNDNLEVNNYKSIDEILDSNQSFEKQLEVAINEYKESAKYLRKYHYTVIPLSGGFDGRLILSFFNETNGLPLETMTYNRAGGKLDFYIAGKLSKKFNVAHKKIRIPTKLIDFKMEVPEFQNSKNDPFTNAFNKSLEGFYETNNCFKVSLGGNGADTDWEFGEKFLKKLNNSNFKSFIEDYCKLITKHPLIKEELSQRLAIKLEKYFKKKYISFKNKDNFIQLLGSAFFHLERFRGRQGFIYSQNSNKTHDVFAPFATESFNKLVYLANKNQLQRGLKEGINYRIYNCMTNGEVHWAPILTAKNQFGNNPIQRLLNRIFPLIPKIIWKLQNGDTNTRLRKGFQSKINDLSKEYILNNTESNLFDYLQENKIKEDLEVNNYRGQYNSIASILKFINNN